VTGLGSAVAVSAGRGHSCALLADGSVVCGGFNGDGQLGNGALTTATTPVAVGGLTGPVTSVSVGNDHGCALLKTGTVACWGKNESGQVGDGTTMDATGATVVPGLTSVVAVSAGTSHTCAVLMGGTAVCWGDNEYGQLGDGTTTSSLVPVTVKTP